MAISLITKCAWLFTLADLSGEPSYSLMYSSKVSEILNTQDNSSLSSDCIQSYSDASNTKTTEMRQEIMEILSETQCSDIVTIVTDTHSFIGFDNLVRIYFTFSQNKVICVKGPDVILHFYRLEIRLLNSSIIFTYINEY